MSGSGSRLPGACRLPAAMLVLSLVGAACAPDDAAPTTVSGTGATVTTAGTTSTTSAPATTLAISTSTTTTSATSVPSTSTTSTLPPETTTTTLPPWVALDLPEALPPESIPWEEVGTGWLLVRYLRAHSGSWDPAAPQALLLIDPEDAMYVVSGWDGAPVLAWSPEGSRVLFFDGLLRMIDLRDGARSVIPVDLPAGLDASAAGYLIEARFTRPTGRDVVVRVQDSDDHVRLECLGTDGSMIARLGEADLVPVYDRPGPDPRYVAKGVTWLYAPTGTEVAVANSSGLSLLSNQGSLIRPLDTPGLGCTLSRWWDGGSVLASCYDSYWADSPCWDQTPAPGGRSLWSVPSDGSPAVRLTPQPICRADWDWLFPHAYWDGLRVAGVVAAPTPACCGCGGSLHFVSGDTVILWRGYAAWESPSGPADPMCAPALVGVRHGRLLVLDAMFGGFGVVFEVAADGTTRRAITPVERGLFGGALQVFTTEETALTVGSW